MKTVKDIIISTSEPPVNNVGWLKPLSNGAFMLYFFNEKGWTPISIESSADAYTKAESDVMLATKQNVLTTGNGVTIEDDVISMEIVQEQGTSTIAVMSQDAVTKALKMSTANASGSVTLQPNTYYTCVDNCDFTLGAMGTTDEVVIKTSGAYSHTFTDADLKWQNEPSFESGKTYLISIQNKLGLWVAFAD